MESERSSRAIAPVHALPMAQPASRKRAAGSRHRMCDSIARGTKIALSATIAGETAFFRAF
jgi:hypothetical protein